MNEPQPRDLANRRGKVSLSEVFEAGLSRYAMAGAAGLSLLGAPSAHAAVVYTVSKTVSGPNSILSIDLNNDGIEDFQIQDHQYMFTDTISSLSAFEDNQNGIAVDTVFAAHAFQFGNEIGPNFKYTAYPDDPIMATSSVSANGNAAQSGQFIDKTNKFLGLRLSLDGNTYYGWARVDVKTAGAALYVELLDYAYQNTPNMPILAGQGIQKTEGTLGALAFGADGIALWRKPSDSKQHSD